LLFDRQTGQIGAMTPISFALDPRLAADTQWVCDWPLCSVLLMNDQRYQWLVMVPRRNGASEIFDLKAADQTILWQEISHAAELLKSFSNCNKINVGALGNVVAQLHVHIVARREGDFAGKGPVWGQGAAQPYSSIEAQALIERLRQLLRAPGS
jgi:diadenosine tetraphosphate (Ap4A) HIT family hydrolase